MDHIEAKLVLLGDTTVGKTSLVQRYVSDIFNSESPESFGAACINKQIIYENKQFNLKIWDTAGQEKYRSIAKNYYKDAKVAILVYDITKNQSFASLEIWLNELMVNGRQDVQLIVVGNKQDLDEKQEVSFDIAMQLVSNFDAVLKFTSCKNNTGVDDVFQTACQLILNPRRKDQIGKTPVLTEQDQDELNLQNNLLQQNKNVKKNCCS